MWQALKYQYFHRSLFAIKYFFKILVIKFHIYSELWVHLFKMMLIYLNKHRKVARKRFYNFFFLILTKEADVLTCIYRYLYIYVYICSCVDIPMCIFFQVCSYLHLVFAVSNWQRLNEISHNKKLWSVKIQYIAFALRKAT